MACSVVSIVKGVFGPVVGLLGRLYTDKKNEKEKRISNVVELYLKNDANRIINGKSGLVRAGAGLLHDESEADEAISRMVLRGSKNPIGADYEKVKEKKLLLKFVKKAAEYTNKAAMVTKSSEEIIKMLEEENED